MSLAPASSLKHQVNIPADCGLPEWALKSRNWRFLVPPVARCYSTHSCSSRPQRRIPKLVKDGFRVKSTVQTSPSNWLKFCLKMPVISKKKTLSIRKTTCERRQKGPYPEIPLYTADDAVKTMPFQQSMARWSKLVMGSKRFFTMLGTYLVQR